MKIKKGKSMGGNADSLFDIGWINDVSLVVEENLTSSSSMISEKKLLYKKVEQVNTRLDLDLVYF